MNLTESFNESEHLNCSHLYTIDFDAVENCTLWLEGLLMPVIGLFGLLGNILTISVLSTKEMASSFNNLIIALSVFDSIFIIFVTFEYTFVRVWSWPVTEDSLIYVFIFPKVIYPLNDICLCCSIYSTIAVSYERYSAVCNPYKYREKNMENMNSSFAKVLSLIICSSVAINIPRFFETKIVSDNNASDSETRNNSMINFPLDFEDFSYTFEVTPLRTDPNYIRFYINGTRIFFTCGLPLLSLVILNYKIHRGIRYSHCRKRQSVKKEINLASIIICIVFVFFCCNISRVVLNISEVIMTGDIIRCGKTFTPPTWFLCATSINHFSLVLNASVNFIIYLSLGRKFRQKAAGTLSKFLGKIHKGVTDCTFRLSCGSGVEDKPSITSANMEQYSVSSDPTSPKVELKSTPV